MILETIYVTRPGHSIKLFPADSLCNNYSGGGVSDLMWSSLLCCCLLSDGAVERLWMTGWHKHVGAKVSGQWAKRHLFWQQDWTSAWALHPAPLSTTVKQIKVETRCLMPVLPQRLDRHLAWRQSSVRLQIEIHPWKWIDIHYRDRLVGDSPSQIQTVARLWTNFQHRCRLWLWNESIL